MKNKITLFYFKFSPTLSIKSMNVPSNLFLTTPMNLINVFTCNVKKKIYDKKKSFSYVNFFQLDHF